MRAFVFPFGLLLLATLVNAQYFSEGWTPGQPVAQTQDAPPAATSVPPEQKERERISPSTILKMLDFNYLITSAPSVALFAQFGINITEKWEGAIALANTWDPRVPLITDENYQDIIANEPLVGRQEEDRVWSLVISVPGRQEGLSQYVDEVFDAAFNTSLVLGDLPNVRWGRIDYLNVTRLTTKWNVWNAPYLVILKNRGKTLRFYQPRYLRLNEEAFRSFLINEDYKYTQPWTSSFAPGGQNEWIMDYIAFALAKIYETMILFPKWLMFVLSGSLASVIINYFHKSSPPPARRQATQPTAETKASGEVQPKATGVALPQTSKRKKANAKESSH